ncbi:heme exporter protein CcmB [Gemmatimonas aurantiaca]|uniref:heme exporter protein CcmB n=1 Tax=Gemmatimonas aurantiaca TaxID=173480 RepID=UPI00301DFB06
MTTPVQAGWRADATRVMAVCVKDLTAERRTKSNFNAIVAMAGMILLLFGFALGADTEGLRNAAAGVLWLTILFSGVLAFNRSYQIELESGALEQLLLYPGERWTIFIGKVLANLAFVLSMEAITLPLTGVLYHVSFPERWPEVLGVLLLGTVGFVTLGTLYAAMASRSRSREVLLPLLLFPMLVPLLLSATQATAALLGGDVMGDSRTWIRLLATFDVIFLVGATWAFPYVMEG